MPETNDDLRASFPPNSRNNKVKKEEVQRKKITKIIKGNVKKQKKSFGKRIAGVFLEDDTKSVGSYILHDVLIPAAKAMISDMVGGGIEMLLFGERRGSRTRRDGGRSYTSYGSYFQPSDRDRDRRPAREMTRVGRSRHDFDELVIETRGEAEEVLSHLFDLTVDYGMASVADLYDLLGVETNFTDNKYGWTDLKDAYVSRVRSGYILNLPRTKPLD